MNECSRIARLASLGRVLMMGIVSAGCAATPAPTTPIRFTDLGHVAPDFQGPFVVEFQAGDRIPVDFEFSGEDFELAPAHPPLEFVAKQHCYLQFSAKGVKASLDPRDFSAKPKTPGSFRFGLHVERGQPARLDVAIATPRR